MGKSMFQLLSLTDAFLLVLSVPYKYYLVQQGKNWSDAQTYCRANYIDLATVEGKDDMIKLQNEAQKHQFTSSAWIGLYNDVNSWRWSMENQPLGSLADWCSDQPNYAMEACAALNQWCWFDVPCSLSYPFLCFDVRNPGSSRYVLISTSMAFHDAQSYCRQHHTDLASVRDVEEYSVIKNTVSSNSWVGLFRDLWKWSDQSNFSNISWVSGKPSGAGKTDNCGHFINGQVDAAQCSEIMPFFCLSDFTKKQIMRMKVQSNQDANDPAVKAAILQKIKQNLKELGIAKNTAMKWREQPDGMVFHKTKENNYEGIKTREKCDL